MPEETPQVTIEAAVSAAPAVLALDNVLREIAFARQFFSERDRVMRRMWRFYHKQHYDAADIPGITTSTDRDQGTQGPNTLMDDDDEWRVTLNIPTNTVDQAVLMLTGEQPVIEVLDRTGKAVGRRTKTEQFLYGMHEINDQRRGQSVIGMATLNQLLYGWGIFKLVWDETRLPAEKRLGGVLLVEKEAPEDVLDEDEFVDMPTEDFPLVLSAPFPLTVYGIPGGRDEPFRGVFQHMNIDWGTLKDILPAVFHHNIPATHLVFDEKLKKDRSVPYMPGDTVEYVDFWREATVLANDGEYRKQIWHAILVADKFVKPPTFMREYEFNAFTIFPCTADTDIESGEHWGLSFLYKLLDAVKHLELAVNQGSRVIEQWADPTLVIKSDEASPPKFSKLSGAINLLSTEESASLLQWQGSPPDVARQITFWQDQVMEMGFPGPGLGKFGGASGIDTIAQQRAALSKIMTPKTNLERGLDLLHTKAISLLQRFAPDTPIAVRGRIQGDDTVQTYNVRLRGRDTRGLRYTRTRVRARFPLDELQNAATVGSMVNQNTYSRRAAMRNFYYIRDVDKMWREMKEEIATLDRGWVTFWQQTLQRKFAEMDERRKAARSASMPQAPAKPMAPPVPPRGPGRPALPEVPQGTLGRGMPGSLEASQNQVVGDLAMGGVDMPPGMMAPGAPNPRDNVLPPATGGEGLSGFLAAIR